MFIFGGKRTLVPDPLPLAYAVYAFINYFFICFESFDLLLLFFSIFIFNNFKTATVRTLFLCYYLRSSFIMFLVCISNDGTDVNTLEQSFFSGKSV